MGWSEFVPSVAGARERDLIGGMLSKCLFLFYCAVLNVKFYTICAFWFLVDGGPFDD